MCLYDRIKKRREELGLSQEELANKLGYKSRSTINKIEAGINDIPQSKIKAFANALNTTPAFLMGWVEERGDEKESVIITDKEKELLSYYNQLNDQGKIKLINEAEDLTHNTKYCKESYLEPLAAHSKSGEKLTVDQRDLDDMDNW